MDTLIRNEWLLRRLFRAEAHLWEYHVIRSDPSEGVLLGAAFDRGSPVFMRLQRRITLCERSYKDAYQDLQRLQSARPADPRDGAVSPGAASSPHTSASPAESPRNEESPTALPPKPANDDRPSSTSASPSEPPRSEASSSALASAARKPANDGRPSSTSALPSDNPRSEASPTALSPAPHARKP